MISTKSLSEQAKQKYNEYMEKVPELRRRRLERFVTLFLTFGALIIFLIFAINPTVSTIINLRRQLKDSLFVRAQVDEKLKNLTLLERSYAAIGTDLPFVFQAIPQTPDAPNFFAQLQGLAANNHLTITSLQADTVPLTVNPADTQTIQLPFTLTITGTYAQTMQFLTALSKSTRIVTLREVAITKSADTSSTVQLVMKGQAYFIP